VLAATARQLGGLCGSWQVQPSDAQQVLGGATQMRHELRAPLAAVARAPESMLARLAGA